MNHRIEDSDQPLFDKLVDGELSASEQRELLLRLDDEPHAWRRLALSFLEAQTWQRELRSDSTTVPSPPTVIHPPVIQSQRRRWSALTVITASVCVVFGLGFACGSLRSSTTASLPITQLPRLDQPLSPVSLRPDSDLLVDTEPDEETIRLYLAGDTPDSYRQVDVPLVKASDDGSNLLAGDAPFVPSQVRRTLEQMGHEVQEQRQLIPLQLSDGREAVVPVEDVRVRYVGQKTYQ